MSIHRQNVLQEIEKQIPHWIAKFNDETADELEVIIHLEAGHCSPSGETLEEGWFGASTRIPHRHGYVDEKDLQAAVDALRLYLHQYDAKQQLKNLLKA